MIKPYSFIQTPTEGQMCKNSIAFSNKLVKHSTKWQAHIHIHLHIPICSMWIHPYTRQIWRTTTSKNQKTNMNNAKLNNNAKYANYVFSFCNVGLCLSSLFFYFLLFILFRSLFDFLMKILIFNNAQIKSGHV